MRPLQKQIIDELKVLPEIDPEKEIRRSVDFIKAYLLKYPFFKSLILICSIISLIFTFYFCIYLLQYFIPKFSI